MISCQWLQGYDCTAGMQSCIDQPVSDDAVIVKVKAWCNQSDSLALAY